MLKQWLKKDHIAIQMLLLASLLLPCLFCWLLGNLYVENIPLGVVDLDNSSFSRQIIRGLEDHPGFTVQYVEDPCLPAVKILLYCQALWFHCQGVVA